MSSHLLKTVLSLSLAACAIWISSPQALPQEELQGGGGLQGILPAEVPADVQVPESLQNTRLNQILQEELPVLYGEGATVEQQRAALQRLAEVADRLQAALENPRYAEVSDEVAELRGALVRRVEVYQGILDLLASLHPASDEDLAAAQEELSQHALDMQSYLSRQNNGDDWNRYLNVDRLVELSSADVPAAEQRMDVARELFEQGEQRSHPTPAMREVLRRPQFRALTEAASAYTRALVLSSPGGVEVVREPLAAMVAALEQYGQTSGEAAAREIRAHLRGLGTWGGPEATALSTAIRRNYANYNVRIVISEEFLNLAIADTRAESGGVRDVISNTDIVGSQTTYSNISANVVPSRNTAAYQVEVSGVTNSSTTGYPRDANNVAVFTATRADWFATKRMELGLDGLTAYPTQVAVSSNSDTLGARTGMSWVPLLGDIVEGIVVRRAEQRSGEARGESEARVRARVATQVEEEVNPQVARTNDFLFNRLQPRLQEQGLWPSSRHLSSTDRHMFIRAMIGEGEVLGGSPAIFGTPNNAYLTLQIHESAANNALDLLRLQGRSFTQEELVEYITGALASLLGREVVLPPSGGPQPEEPPAEGEEDVPTTVHFAGEDPLRVQFRNGAIDLYVRVAFERETRTPDQVARISIRPSVEGNQLILQRVEDIEVNPAVAPQGAAAVAQQAVTSQLVAQELTRLFPGRREIDGTVEVTAIGDEPMALSILQLKAVDGWLSVSLR